MHTRRELLRCLGGLLLAAPLATGPAHAADDGLVVIGHSALKAMDAELLRRVYSGRTVEVDGQPLRPLNLVSPSPLRQRFMKAVLQQDDEDYVAYWTVRRYIGKGVPPRELRSSAEVLEAVARTPGAIGYIEAAELRPGVSVLLRR